MIDNILTPRLDYINMKLQPFSLLSQQDQITENILCNSSTTTGCEHNFCKCTHVINVFLDAVVELVLVDMGTTYYLNHPFHLHGHSFRVVAMDKIAGQINVSMIQELDRLSQIKRNLIDASLKDTVPTLDGGYTILRFKANNPGYWLFHCHVQFHSELGMSLVFKIGDEDQMPPVPSEFPKCGDYFNEEVKNQFRASASAKVGFVQIMFYFIIALSTPIWR